MNSWLVIATDEKSHGEPVPRHTGYIKACATLAFELMSYEIRTFTPGNHPAAIVLEDAVYPHWRGSDDYRYWRPARQYDEHREPAAAFGAWNGDMIVGYAAVRSVRDDRARADLMVHPEYAGQGIGTALFDRLLETGIGATHNLQARVEIPGASQTSSTAPPLLPEVSVEFLRNRGFLETEIMHGLILNRDRFEPMSFVRLIDRLEVQGISITSLAAERRTQPAYMERLQSLEDAVPRSVPDGDPEPAEFTPVAYDDFASAVEEELDRYESAYLIAKADDLYVGRTSPFDGATLVRPEYRGRGIATAMMAKGVELALRNGRPSLFMRTSDEPMLTVAKRLGYRRYAAEIRLLRPADNASLSKVI